jgi:hypothetical protein
MDIDNAVTSVMTCLFSIKTRRGFGLFGCALQPADRSLAHAVRRSCTHKQYAKNLFQVSSGIAVTLCLQLSSPLYAR